MMSCLVFVYFVDFIRSLQLFDTFPSRKGNGEYFSLTPITAIFLAL